MGIAGAVPPSLASMSNIDVILQLASEVEVEDTIIARILCEQAYGMAQKLDPKSEGRGVVLFKAGLLSVIRQKGQKVDHEWDIEHLWNYYQAYKRCHKVEDVQKECDRLTESEISSSSFGRMRKVCGKLRVLIDVLEALVGDSPYDEVGKHIIEEVRKVKKADMTFNKLTPYNIVPLDAPSLANVIGFFTEMKVAITAISYPADFCKLPHDVKPPKSRGFDIFDLLEYVFGFQKDNVRNQRENVVLMLANSQSRYGVPADLEPKIDGNVAIEVFSKVLDNYVKWCKYLGFHVAWNSAEAIHGDRKIAMVCLYFLVWGEAANIRFLPECLCYIFHNMAKEFDAILNQSEAQPASSCVKEDGSISFLDQIILPIYTTMKAEAQNGRTGHSGWRNYDDFNEYFWSPSCVKLEWPPSKNSEFLFKPTKKRRTGKTSFVEHRTFLHLYRSFHRLWIFLIVFFQGLVVIAFNKGTMNPDTIKEVLSVFPTYAVMKFMTSSLDILLMFGAYKTTRHFALSRLFIRFLWFGASSAFITYLYINVLKEKAQSNSESTFYRIFVLIVGIYAAIRASFALLVKFPVCHAASDVSEKWPFFQFFKWIYQERYYVGRGLYERTSDYLRYVLYWLVLLGCKFTFAYFLQIKPLVEPTNMIITLENFQYSWHDLVSKGNNNALTLACLWAPVAAIYLMDIHLWYTLLSAIVGSIKGAQARLGKIRSTEMLHKCFESFPEAFTRSLVSPQLNRAFLTRQSVQEPEVSKKAHAATFAPFWNEIIKSLREEDYISNWEMKLLLMPRNCGNLRLVQWPLFLLSSKVFLALDLAFDFKDTQADLWNKISRDKYMVYAVKECYHSVERILLSLLDNEGRLWVERLFRELSNSVAEGSLMVNVNMKKLSSLLSRLSRLTGLLVRDESPELASSIPMAVFDLYNVITHEFLTANLREKVDSRNILAQPRNKGKLFSRINLPNDPECRELVKRLHFLLTVKESAANIPKNLEANRRLQFFTNSLFMNMPPAKPISEMIPFSVITPYYNETVLYSSSDLCAENEDGISILFYLQKIFPDEWKNFLERMESDAESAELLQKTKSKSLELRFWVSYRGQTLARTVRGMMYYRKALILQAYLERKELGGIEDGFSGSDQIDIEGYQKSFEFRAQADLKFTYVISCQIYGQQKQNKAPEATDISLLMQRNEALRVAFIHTEERDLPKGKALEFYSKLVKSDSNGKDQEVYSIKLPGDPILGEGKPENQNHAIIFTRGDALQTIDMNQDNYLEEAMKMRNLLEEFRQDHGLRPATILGIRENIFTGSVSSVADFMAIQHLSFVTLCQRVLADPLRVRMHYGHPDVFDRIFHITRGGVSKASCLINISEDIYAGFNSTLRQGNVTHHEYIQVGKGRDLGLNQIALFDGKVAGGNGEQVLSRDLYRIGQLFDFFKMMSFYSNSVGFYVCDMMTVITLYFFLYGRVYLAFSGLDSEISRTRLLGNKAIVTTLNIQMLVQIGIFTAVPIVMSVILEKGLSKLRLCAVFFTFSLGTRAQYFGRTILHGGAKYQATGRGFVVKHIKFAENYRLYSRSHFVKGAVEDFDDWAGWLLYRGGVRVKGENSWESWWEEEQTHIKTLRGQILETILSLRFFMFQYGIVYKLNLTGKNTSLALYGYSWVALACVVLIFKVFTFSPRKSANYRLILRFVQGLASVGLISALVLGVVLTPLSIADLFAIFLAFVATGWALLSMAIAWRKWVKRLGMWHWVREIARMYDAGMGMLIFAPVAFLSWFPFVSTFQSGILFNQAFSRDLEISIILAGNKANVHA